MECRSFDEIRNLQTHQKEFKIRLVEVKLQDFVKWHQKESSKIRLVEVKLQHFSVPNGIPR